ncbi:Phosphoserine phosphatase / 1-acyl-sn-glycerol-3-phosphate acyltransferase [Alloactinosynnema sp. L-07]|uniref:HAD-IB family hydrolase n=1 Tax=Alloactinosynnema sp. L-07 TaxID=1653480 RepID=UPI00065F09FA|nr:HAD-IB family hydrolase [Alloactinosynnema sp. L-07]CRK56121.1 Phosphoserine phosphatase / 1-acyl-sn-glycerol-3-phosphate acyltransferase [Alloactinosynnema sp. L-07]
MITPEDVVASIHSGPGGPRIGAFFDLDGTVVAGYTASAFWNDRLRSRDIGVGEFTRTMVAALDGNLLGGNPTKIGDVSVGGLRGRGEDELVELGERLFVQKTAGTIRPQARDLVRAHLKMGHTVAFASAATRFQIEPIAADLGVTHVLCTELETEDGILTGRLAGKMLWGEPKARAVRQFARDKGIDLAASHAYANGDEDVAFLASAGLPYAINPHRGLLDAAALQKWPVLRLREPRKAGLRSVLGTVGALAGLNVGLGVGAALGILNRDRKFGINTGIPLACDSALALAGVKLNVIGEHNLWRARPSIFIGNHQSSLDSIVMGSLLRKDFTAVGKKEAQYDPRTLIGGLLLDPAFIDRSNPEKAIAELDKLGERIRSGTSIVIFPEGARAPTPALARFKKGAFHIAIQAGVPMVPIVLRNTGELMWRRSKLVHPGTVEVCVLDPIPTDDWKVEDLDRITAEVRQKFVDTLEKWPDREGD